MQRREPMKMMRTGLVAGVALIATLGFAASASADSTTVRGHSPDGPRGDTIDADGNEIPDEGVYVTGKYTSLYAYDDNGDSYWDLGDGREQGTVGSVEELDQETLTTCTYVNVYRADFGNDPFMDEGWIRNNIRCSGFDDQGTYSYLIVSEEDPRYTGNPDHAIWGTWEYHVYTVSGSGNLVRPKTHVG